MTVGTLIALFFLPDVKTIGSIPSGMPNLYTPEFQWNSIADILSPALMIALLGSIDSLLTSLVADTKTRTRHNPNRELIGQGIGNLAAGIVGGLPGAGATMGTLTNVGAGGRSRVSGMIAALLLLGLLVWFGGIAEPVPLSVLAAVLIRVGVDIIEWRYVTRLLVIRREYVVVMLITFFMTILFDLIFAVALGIIVAGIVQSRRLGGAELDSVQSIPLINFLGAKT
ncbi:MAG: SulP family inorganic anion transporter, partial [Gammaproteobacteria bacterium]|nr:SulP family inorganic anion transporter [Gammaproteobacteria bacterium]